MAEKLRLTKAWAIRLVLEKLAHNMPTDEFRRMVMKRFDTSDWQIHELLHMEGEIFYALQTAVKRFIAQKDLFLSLGGSLDQLKRQCGISINPRIGRIQVSFGERDIRLGMGVVKQVPKQPRQVYDLYRDLTKEQRLKKFGDLIIAIAQQCLEREMRQRGQDWFPSREQVKSRKRKR